MPREDFIHNAVKNALIKDGWTITDEHYEIKFEERRVYVDLAAERPLAAEKDGEKIAVEIKTFGGASLMSELQKALGQYDVYVAFLSVLEAERKVYMAVSDITFENFFQEKAVQFLLNRNKVLILVVDIEKEEIVKWIN